MCAPSGRFLQGAIHTSPGAGRFERVCDGCRCLVGMPADRFQSLCFTAVIMISIRAPRAGPATAMVARTGGCRTCA